MTDPIPGLPDELLDPPSTIDADRAEALIVACPGCGARPGDECVGVTGKPVSMPAHPKRYRAAGITASAIPTPDRTDQ